jgi:methionine-rich copper-binding protein CopC
MNMMKKKIVVAIAILLLGTISALAHTKLKSSNIDSGKLYAKAPTVIEIVFTAAVGLAEVQLQTGNEDIPLAYSYPDKMQTTFTIPFPALKSGSYIFFWRAVAKDGHAMTGEIAFSVE